MNDLAEDLIERIAIGAETGEAEVLICPPTTLISGAAKHGSGIAIGDQDCQFETNASHTGDISARMLKDAGASHITVDFSERRADHSDTDETVQVQCRTALGTELTTILYAVEPLFRTQGTKHIGHYQWPIGRIGA